MYVIETMEIRSLYLIIIISLSHSLPTSVEKAKRVRKTIKVLYIAPRKRHLVTNSSTSNLKSIFVKQTAFTNIYIYI